MENKLVAKKNPPFDIKWFISYGLNRYIRFGDIKMYIVPIKVIILLLRYLIVTVWVINMVLVQVDFLFPFRRLFYALQLQSELTLKLGFSHEYWHGRTY